MKRVVLTLLIGMIGVSALPAGVCYTPTYYAYRYHPSGWWRGRWYPAGDYYWNGYAWYLRGYGVHYGLNHNPYVFHVKPVVIPVAAFQPVPVYFGTYAGGQTPAPQGSPTPGYSSAPAPLPQRTPNANQDTSIILEAINKLGARFEPLEKRVADIEKDLSILKKTPPPTPARGETPPPTPPQEEDKGFSIMTAACIRCHLEGKLVKTPKATNFALFAKDGSENPLTKKQKEQVLKRIKAKEMPPQPNAHDLPPLSEEEYKLVEERLTKWKVKE